MVQNNAGRKGGAAAEVQVRRGGAGPGWAYMGREMQALWLSFGIRGHRTDME